MKPQALIYSDEMFRAKVLAQETTRLDLLTDIDATVDMLAKRACDFRKAISNFSVFEPRISSYEVIKGIYLDRDYVVISALEEAEATLKAYLPRMMVKRASIERDTRLTEDHRESLHDAYDEVMEAAAMFHESIQLTRAAIIRHDMEAEPREALPVFDTVEALISDLRGT